MDKRSGYVFKTSKGSMAIATAAEAICAITHPCDDEAKARRALEEMCPDGVNFDQIENNPLAERCAAKISSYFEGKRVTFDEPTDLSAVSAFHRQVLESVRDIPYGEVKSYGWVARQIGHPKTARAVGQALHRNPVPIIVPCHRVVASNGKMQGFGWGIDFKEWLIKLENEPR